MPITKTKRIKPVKSKWAELEDLPAWYETAIETALQGTGFWLAEFDSTVRIETYKMTDIIRLFNGIFNWPMTIDEIKGKSSTPAYNNQHIARIEKIIRHIQEPQPPWPYISFRAETMKELQEVNDEGNYISVPNHGDGWHRMVALNTMKFKQADILFMKR